MAYIQSFRPKTVSILAENTFICWVYCFEDLLQLSDLILISE